MTVRTSVKAGGTSFQHAQSAVVVKTGVKAGGLNLGNHSQAVTSSTGVKGGGMLNHAQAAVVV